MASFFTLVQVYIVGGLTFIPLVLLGIFTHGYLTFPHVDTTKSTIKQSQDDLRDSADDDKNIVSGSSSIAEKLRKDRDKDVAEGYFAVCREYVPGGVNGKPPVRTTPAGEVIAQESPSVYQNMYRSLFERKQASTLDPSKTDGTKVIKRARNIFYVVLRHGHLLLYDDSEQVEVRHVISLAHHDISIYAGGHAIPEGELFIKRNAICLKRRATTLDKGSTTLPFYFFNENCSDKEDFYFALLRSQDKTTHDGPPPPQVQDFDVKDIISLVQRLHSSEEHLQTRWLNAIIGRIFLALYKTKFMEEFVRAKISKKISRVKKPAILSGIVLRDVDMGHSGPLITNPKLRDLTVDGEYCAEAQVSYEGGFRVEIGATARLDLGQRFKAREVTLVLAIVIKKLEGKLLLRIKPPPSNRIWMSFETMPQFELDVEPVVSSRQITYSIVHRAIESRIREVLAETLVLPHWDDSPFYGTMEQLFRGGIWAPQEKDVAKEETEIPDDIPEDEAETNSDEINGLKSPDDRTHSMPHLPISGETSLHRRGHKTTSSLVTNEERSASTGVQKPSEMPKILRTTSFASAADPLVNTASANSSVASRTPTKKSRSQKDAASYITEINNRSQPTSPIAVPVGKTADSIESNGRSDSISSASSIIEGLDDKFSIARDSTVSSETASQSDSLKENLKTKTGRFTTDSLQHTKFQGLAKQLTPSDKKQQAMIAAAAAAKNWGWNTFSKKQRPNSDGTATDEKAGTPENPIGRGRPLPPPGMPLPGPDGKRASMLSLSLAKRKPVPVPAAPNTQTTSDKTTPPLPPRAHRRGSSMADQGIENDPAMPGMLIVEAPQDSGPQTPADDYGEFMDNINGEEEEEAHIHESPIETEAPISEVVEPQATPSRRALSEKFASSYEDEDSHGLASWKIAQEEEARQKNLWMNEHEHEQ